MKVLKVFSLLLAVVYFLVGCDKKQETIQGTTPIIVGVSVDNHPWEYYKDGNPVGFDIDLMHIIGNRLGRSIVIKDMSFDGLLGALQSRSIDVAISAMTPTEERRKAVDMTQKYHEAETELVCLKASSIQSLQDLKGLTVGAQQGSTYEQFAQQKLVGTLSIKIKSLNKIPELLHEIKMGRVACLIIGRSEAQAIVEEMPEMKTIPVERDTTGGEAIALPKGSALTVQIDAIISALKKDGTLKMLGAKWLLKE